jgi:phage-related minor tail protein
MSLIDFNKLSAEIEAEEQAATVPVPSPGPEAYAPVPALPPAFAHAPEVQANLTRTGALASEAVAREFIDTATAIKSIGNDYAGQLRSVADHLRGIATELDNEANDVVTRMQAAADEYEKKGRSLFELIGQASTLSTKALDTVAELTKSLNGG